MIPTYAQDTTIMKEVENEGNKMAYELQLTEVRKDHITYAKKIRDYVTDCYTYDFLKKSIRKLVVHLFGVEQNLSRIDRVVTELASSKKYDKSVCFDILYSLYIAVINNFNAVLLVPR